jgi:uncharacterized protein YjbI with pentapeptide repeats
MNFFYNPEYQIPELYDNVSTHCLLKAISLDYSGQNLRGRSFKGQNLEGANFSGADIRGADFSGATPLPLEDSRLGSRGAGEREEIALGILHQKGSNLTVANFSHTKAGLQKHWIVSLMSVRTAISI